MSYYIMDKLYKKALKYGASDFGISDKKDKRFFVIYDNHMINFGYKYGKTYIDHHNKKKREAWYARHSKIYDSSGRQVINNPYSASYWSARILW